MRRSCRGTGRSTSERGTDGLRIAVAGGYFKCKTARGVLRRGSRRGGARRQSRHRDPASRARAFAPLSLSPRAKARACISTGCAPAPHDYDPAVRDRLIAGAMTPAALVVKAQKFRRWYRDEVLKLFAEVDAILAPATPCAAPLIGQQTFRFGEAELPVRANLGHLYPADLVYRPAGCRRAGAARAAADRGPDHRRALARGRGVANRTCA